MEENVLIKSDHYSIKKLVILSSIFAIIVSVSMLLYYTFDSWKIRDHITYYNHAVEDKCLHHIFTFNCGVGSYANSGLIHDYMRYGANCPHFCGDLDILIGDLKNDEIYRRFISAHPNFLSYLICDCKDTTYVSLVQYLLSFIPMLIAIILLIFNWWSKEHSLIVTDSRIYGKSTFEKQVDIPFDLISSVSIHKILNGIKIGTSYGKINFLLVKNQNDIVNVLRDLLIERQNQKKTTMSNEPSVVQNSSNADELKKYKDLLDNGVITLEEFEAKKKQLLDL